nr:putative zinc finger, CCHC-type [Tanacetum cinerariifolium]
MSNIEKIKFPALDITGANYIQWTENIKRHLKSIGALAMIQEGGKCSEETKAKADVFLHQHIDEMLEFEYSNFDDPSILWKDLETKFNNQREVLLPSDRDEWNNVRFQNFKKVNEYTSALFRICRTLRFCRQTVTEADMLEKTFFIFHASNINLQQQYRLQNFKRNSDLNVNLLVGEKNNELLMKNHQTRPTGSLALTKANVLTIMITKTLEAKKEEVTLVGVGVVVEIMVTTIFPTETILTTEVVIMIVVVAVVVVKEITLTMLHKLIVSISKIMKLVPPKTPKDPVSGVEVQIIGQKLVARLHIYKFKMSLNRAQYQAKDGELCIADSGATHTILKSKKYVFKLKPAKGTIDTILGLTNLIDEAVKVNVVLPNGTQLLIENALFSPKSKRNLLSFRNIYHNGYDTRSRTIGNKKYLHIMNENQVFEKLPMFNSGFHYTHINVPQAHMAVKEKYCYTGIFILWHDRLGHPGSTMIKRIIENTHGHPLKDQKFSKIDKVPLCTSCSFRKLIARPSPLKVKNESPMFLERIQGDLFTACFADCHFDESVFLKVRGVKKNQEKDVTWCEPSLLYLDPRTKQSANAPARVEIPNKQADDNITRKSQKHLKRGRPIGSKDKNPLKRKRTKKNSSHDENVLDETQDIKTSPGEEMNDNNKEMSINYSQSHILWDQNKIGDIDEIFYYFVARDIMSVDDDPEPKSIEHMHIGIIIHQSNYKEKLLKRFNMDKAKPLSTPMVRRSLNVDNDPFRPCEDDEEVLGPETLVATSSNHAEVIALHEASRECVWLRSMTQLILTSCGLEKDRNPTLIYEDNSACVSQMKKDGICMESPHLVKHEFFEHFKNRFEKPNKSRILLERDFVKRNSLEQNDDLEREVSNEEIKRTVWDCGIDKAPCPDGFTFGFYRRYWDIIGIDVVDAVKWFFFAWRDPERRPISLIGSLYKVIAKHLANRLVTVLDDIVDEIQSISHLFYADDAIFMGQWSQCNIDTIIRVLDVFYRASGLRINMNKSNLMGISVDSNKVKHAAAKIAWYGDIAFKNLVPRLYALESMKNVEVASKLSHGGLEFSFRRNPRGGGEQAQFERLKEIVEGVTLRRSIPLKIGVNGSHPSGSR